MPFVAALLIAAAALWRVLAVHAPELANFSPLMALAFCGGVYFRFGWMWLVPFAAAGLSDVWIDHLYAVEYHYGFSYGGAAIRFACLAASLGMGRLVAGQRSWTGLFGGCAACSSLFYLVTNTLSWIGDAGYAHDAAGWWQAMTVGHPQFAPTIFFFRNSFFSDMLFTGLFALAMEFIALRRGDASLLRPAAVKR